MVPSQVQFVELRGGEDAFDGVATRGANQFLDSLVWQAPRIDHRKHVAILRLLPMLTEDKKSHRLSAELLCEVA